MAELTRLQREALIRDRIARARIALEDAVKQERQRERPSPRRIATEDRLEEMASEPAVVQ
jgi:hypothetical protein